MARIRDLTEARVVIDVTLIVVVIFSPRDETLIEQPLKSSPNKVGHTATQVACGWAGAVIKKG